MSELRTVIRDEVRTVICDEMHDYFSTTISGIMNQVMSARPRTGASVSGNVNQIMSESDHPRAGAPGIFNFLHRGWTADSSSSEGEGAKGGQLVASRPHTSSAWMTGTPQRFETVESVAPAEWRGKCWTGGEASVGFHGGVRDATEEFNGGADEGDITGSKVGD
jgi:hypothetical protein